MLRIYVVPVACNFGWLVSSRDPSWASSDSLYFTPKQGKARAIRYARKIAMKRGGASVRIQKKNGQFQEERTYPRSRDPRRSRG